MKYPHYSDNGLTGAPAVVFLGSLGTTLEMWEPQLQAFGRHYRTIAVDLPGHGRTAVPDDRCTVRGFADQVVTLLDALGVDRFSVVGLSFGGAVAQALAGIWPDRVVGAVIACPAPSYDSDFWRSRALYVRTHGLIEIVRPHTTPRYCCLASPRRPWCWRASGSGDASVSGARSRRGGARRDPADSGRLRASRKRGGPAGVQRPRRGTSREFDSAFRAGVPHSGTADWQPGFAPGMLGPAAIGRT
ncbi:alpha/beta fold hydrolase [Nocardia vinacea]|uniref:alpha/beta fold hydrolase n=1 Tax=Nocardia vinacea TaxID=96468 RepID=UPI003AF38AB6